VSAKFLQHELLAACGVRHGFGVKDAEPPAGLLRPRQVHGVDIVTSAECDGPEPPAADGIVSNEAGLPVAVITADCVPILVSTRSGDAVAAVHAGWRGLAAGVVAAGTERLRAFAGSQPLVAAIGPHIGPCCYEVDAPVTDALRARFGAECAAAEIATRPGHARVDLGRLARADLIACGIDPEKVGGIPGACTRCDAERFHSYRRDGTAAGRLVHFISARLHQA
jgi:YfiH family protein